MLILLNGSMAGLGGIICGLLRPLTADKLWRIVVIAGLVLTQATCRVFM